MIGFVKMFYLKLCFDLFEIYAQTTKQHSLYFSLRGSLLILHSNQTILYYYYISQLTSHIKYSIYTARCFFKCINIKNKECIQFILNQSLY